MINKKRAVILSLILLLISFVYAQELEPGLESGGLWINGIFIPYSVETQLGAEECKIDNPFDCEGIEINDECNACRELCDWVGGEVRVCCPRGYIWEQGCRSPLEVGKEVEKPDCNDLDFNGDGDVGISDAGAIGEKEIDYNEDGKYSWLDRVLFLWDIKLFGDLECEWDDEDLLTLALSGNPDVCDKIRDVKLKNACNHINIVGTMLAGDSDVKKALEECDEKFDDVIEKLNCFNRVSVFSGRCGNGILEEGEECDGDDVGEASCADVNEEGEVSCSLCKIDYSGCFAKRCNDLKYTRKVHKVHLGAGSEFLYQEEVTRNGYTVNSWTLDNGKDIVACSFDPPESPPYGYVYERDPDTYHFRKGLCGEGYSECTLSNYVDLYNERKLPLKDNAGKILEKFRFYSGVYETSTDSGIKGDYLGNTHVSFNYADSGHTDYWMGIDDTLYGNWYVINGVLCCK